MKRREFITKALLSMAALSLVGSYVPASEAVVEALTLPVAVPPPLVSGISLAHFFAIHPGQLSLLPISYLEQASKIIRAKENDSRGK